MRTSQFLVPYLFTNSLWRDHCRFAMVKKPAGCVTPIHVRNLCPSQRTRLRPGHFRFNFETSKLLLSLLVLMNAYHRTT